ncbi:Ankyrin repeat-containing domain protein [Akanthomyces lecanii RCEF 1005]|uniref:Ankyrin repeat-containing domain protein n=1 Tax=Akanthomyces lecanii RCEF 1005 TaxID=1081108 RepID=A0A162JJK1_CORDF|nr:Ankyrin repeat-containing domain protein [Akanthomyces lecanii RCEF 1005]
MENGLTALQVAAHYKHLDIAQLLVENGAKLDVNDGLDGKTPLRIAVEAGNTNLVRMLLKHNANPNMPALRDAPIHTAVHSESQDILKLLLDAGAVTELLNGNGETPLIIATGKGNISIAKYLLNLEADADSSKAKSSSLLLAACRKGHLDMAGLLLKYGASIDKADAEGNTPLFLAV